MSTAIAIMVAAAALACPLHMLWRMRQGRRACCPPARSHAAAALRERERELGARIESLASSEARREAAPERH
jgi:hypothetical protein